MKSGSISNKNEHGINEHGINELDVNTYVWLRFEKETSDWLEKVSRTQSNKTESLEQPKIFCPIPIHNNFLADVAFLKGITNSIEKKHHEWMVYLYNDQESLRRLIEENTDIPNEK